LIDVAIDSFLRGLLNFGGRREIRKTLSEIDGAMLGREARHFTNYGFGELRGLVA
jgi:hypothetical protein